MNYSANGDERGLKTEFTLTGLHHSLANSRGGRDATAQHNPPPTSPENPEGPFDRPWPEILDDGAEGVQEVFAGDTDEGMVRWSKRMAYPGFR